MARKPLTVQKRTAQEQLAGRKSRRVVARRLKDQIWTGRDPETNPFPRAEFAEDKSVQLPPQVTEATVRANGYYDPHVLFTIELRVLGLPTTRNDRLNRICDGISESIKTILAQHSLRSTEGRITINNGQIDRDNGEKP